jgi:OmpA-OmpF porin, OOP family
MRRVIAGLLLVCAPLLAFAGDEAGHWYLAPYVGGMTPDSLWETKQGVQLDYGLWTGYNFTEGWTLELNLNGARPAFKDDAGHLGLYAASLDVLRVWNRSDTFAPYIKLGLGALFVRPSNTSNNTFYLAEAGVGAFIKLWENADASRSFSLRPDLTIRGDRFTQSNSRTDYLFNLGFVFSFGPGIAPPAAAPPPPPPAPPPAPPPPPPPPPTPQCPGLAPGTVIPPGTATDANGCPIRGDVVLQGVNFETNSATLTGDSKPILDKVAAGLKEHPHLIVELQGHTDSTGSARYNLGLSERRAESVREYLISQGVSPSQLTAKGFGATQPIASNSTAEGRAQNRRVVMHVVDNPGDVTIHQAGQQ